MTDIPYVATTPFVPTDDFEGLCDVISVLALTYVPIEQVQQFIENLGNLHTRMPANTSPRRVMMHRFIALRLQQQLDEQQG
ncbi:hypothetical protein [Xanthomonas arboricola]|uniref:hypothetical protein n=1 Tax=Xanthomonas arboricola TaxID=56448 RepID=UPI000F8E6553|nr:hypothetical protein [Xanthomonas arboricola]